MNDCVNAGRIIRISSILSKMTSLFQPLVYFRLSLLPSSHQIWWQKCPQLFSSWSPGHLTYSWWFERDFYVAGRRIIVAVYVAVYVRLMISPRHLHSSLYTHVYFCENCVFLKFLTFVSEDWNRHWFDVEFHSDSFPWSWTFLHRSRELTALTLIQWEINIVYLLFINKKESNKLSYSWFRHNIASSRGRGNDGMEVGILR